MKCVGYDYKFEKHLVRSLKGIKPPSPGSSKRKPVTKDGGAASEDEDGWRGADYVSDGSPPSKRQRMAKGKAKLIRYDWSGANHHGDSQDEDYNPAAN